MRVMAKNGQSVTEYAIVFSVVAAAILGMQIFVKRGLQAKEHDVTNYFTKVTGDSLGVGSVGTTAQYEPYYAQSDYTVAQSSKSKDNVTTGGKVDRTVEKDDTTRTGSSTTGVTISADSAWRGSQ